MLARRQKEVDEVGPIDLTRRCAERNDDPPRLFFQFDSCYARLKSELRAEFEEMLLELDAAAAAQRAEAEAVLAAAVERVNAANESLEAREADLQRFKRELTALFQDLNQ